MNPKWYGRRQSTMIEDRRKVRDINRPVVENATDPDPNPAEVSLRQARMDRFRAQTAMFPMEEYRPNAFKRRFRK